MSPEPDATESDQRKAFREALERKKNANHLSEEHLDAGSKAAGSRGNKSHQQQFRRKSV